MLPVREIQMISMNKSGGIWQGSLTWPVGSKAKMAVLNPEAAIYGIKEEKNVVKGPQTIPWSESEAGYRPLERGLGGLKGIAAGAREDWKGMACFKLSLKEEK